MVTLRGTDFASVKAQVEQASEWLKVQAPAQPPAQSTKQPEGWCSKHSVQMKLNHQDGRSWWSHKVRRESGMEECRNAIGYTGAR
jgi:hypothetical protein